MSERDLRLNCERCGDFTEPHYKESDPSTVFRCGQCGKKHSDNSVHMVELSKRYERDETGALLEDLP